ncbi:MAG: 2OG-Fe dioxygenase family protein [Acetobacteraceae bacterium]|nr:2OG-Fe dioxygenase family protein [Acetobacteraceae bacterium]
MSETTVKAWEELAARIRSDGFAFVQGAEARTFFEQCGSLSDWDHFAASWNDLGLDTYMADGGRYRKRRHAAFGVDGGEAPIQRKAHQAHYQSRDYNALNGGIARWFDPVLPGVANGPSMTAILAACRALFEQLNEARRWHIEVHQFRIEAYAAEQGRPTPEGMHRDGVDHVLVLLVRRQNIQSGVTSIHDLDGRLLGSFTLTNPMDAALVDDHRVMHGVTPVTPIDPTQAGFRDVLVVTFQSVG